jgi:hypothetical protein
MLASGNRALGAGFRHGDRVTVRSAGEVLATLDSDGKLEGMPFLPEMAPSCGKTFSVHRRAEKTCVEGIGVRGLANVVLLEGLRCDGSAHDGCQRGCLLFWKDAWLKPAAGGSPPSRTAEAAPAESAPCGDGDAAVAALRGLPTTKEGRFYCQSTELAGATSDALPGRLRYHLRNLWTGETSPRRFARFLRMSLLNHLWRRLHGRTFQQLTGQQARTQSQELDLRPGEIVEIKSSAEIRATLDAQGRNRGLRFEPEMVYYCGRRFRVAEPVRKIISERNGKMLELADTVRLEGLVCDGLCYGDCPRANHFFWREIWLRRV